MMRNLMRPAVLAAAMAMTSPAFAGGLNVTVDGVRNNKGSVVVLVFDSEDAYNRLDWQNAVQYAELPSRTGRLSHAFPDLTQGPYAVLVFHDENGDQDLNFRGNRVLEGVGASGSATSTWSPTFAQAAVEPGNVTVRIFYDP